MQPPIAGTPALLDALDEDLVYALRELGAALVEAVSLQDAGTPAYGAPAFRLRLADGRTLKARHFVDEAGAESVEYALRHLQHPCFPHVVARRGRVLLTEWVAGRPLTDADCSPARLRECGALQGFVHAVPIAPDAPDQPANPIGSSWARLRTGISALTAADILQEHESHRAVELAERHAPAACALGFAHNDFCAENIVLTPAGDVSVIDNEMLGIGPLDYDLGRTWYRWPMTPAQRAAYLDGYRRHRSSQDFERHFYYWTLVATVDGASFRMRTSPPTAAVPLARLRTLLAQADRDLSPSATVYSS